MSVSGVGGSGSTDSSASVGAEYSVTVAKKALDATAVDGQNALQLIDSSKAPPVKPGHSLSVMA